MANRLDGMENASAEQAEANQRQADGSDEQHIMAAAIGVAPEDAASRSAAAR